ncbi:MAG TPA: peptidoglycan DD-metalloendopeptidase family protein [Thermodesulfobacteriota bacterium]|nr:peptidoglycan DD-metalloendopeptidase family protein [Thermodesulfobacteriota bacterium]
MKRLALPIAAVFLFLFCSAAWAVERGDLSTKEESLESVKKRITEERKKIKEILSKETSVLTEIDRLNRKIVSNKKELSGVEASLERVQKNINSTAVNIKKLEIERGLLSKRLENRLKAMYKMRNGEVLNAFLTDDLSGSVDLGRRHMYMAAISETDSALIEECEKNLLELKRERKRHEGLKSEQSTAKKTIVARKTEAEALHTDKRAVLSGVKKEKELSLKVLKELEEAAAELTELVESLRAEETFLRGGFEAMKGRLSMPVRGTVTSFFGKVEHPKFKTITFNNGIIIEAPAGSPVRSVYDGRVIYTGWLKGYGQLMILDHGEGFYTLFAHLDRFLKDRGEAVKKGESVALVGDTGPEASAGLYFEIRKRGVPEDPMNWVAGR